MVQYEEEEKDCLDLFDEFDLTEEDLNIIKIKENEVHLHSFVTKR